MTESTSQLTLDELYENLSLFDEWEEKFLYLLDLGKTLPPMPEEDKTMATRIKGCQSRVFLKPITNPETTHIDFVAQSDSSIVNGLIAILRLLYAGKPAEDALALESGPIFRRLELDDHLSPTRRNGLAALVTRIRQIAEHRLKEQI